MNNTANITIRNYSPWDIAVLKGSKNIGSVTYNRENHIYTARDNERNILGESTNQHNAVEMVARGM